MPKRRRYIPLKERYAAALACLLPHELRDDMRRARLPAGRVISLFEVDHIDLHCWGGVDRWHNLDPKLKAEHREKSRVDTGRAAKVRRLDDKWREFLRAVNKGRKPRKQRSTWRPRRLRRVSR